MRRVIAAAVALLGAALLTVNLVGLTKDYTVPPDAIPRAASANPEPRPLTRLSGEDEMDYFRRLTTAVHQRMVHWGSLQHGGEDPVAVWDNWILATAGVIAWHDWEFWDHERALGRGWGLCSQHTKIVFDVLEDQGYSPRRLDWSAHSVVEVESSDGRQAILDADLNVMLAHSQAEMAARPALARPAYARVRAHENGFAGKTPAWMADWAEALWRVPPEVVTAQRYPPERQMESIAYALKWPVPALLLAGGAWTLLRRRRGAAAATGR